MSRLPDLTAARALDETAASFITLARSIAASKSADSAASFFRAAGRPAQHVALVERAAVGAGTTADGAWGSELSDVAPLGRAFARLITPRTILGKLATVRAPFQTPIPAQLGSAAGGWVAPGRPMAITDLVFSKTALSRLKLATCVVVTREMLAGDSDANERLLEEALRRAIVATTDAAFVDPASTAVDEEAAGSITSTGIEVALSGGDSAAEAAAVMREAVLALIDAGSELAAPAWIMSQASAAFLGSLDDRRFVNVGPLGGTVSGIPVITSASAGSTVALVDGAEILVADEGGIEIRKSEAGTIEMSDAPSQDAITGTGASLVSLWQTNSVALAAARIINWLAPRPHAACAWFDAASWGSGT